MDHSKDEFLSRPTACAALMIGEVIAQQEERYLVRSDGGTFLSQRSESCLLLPAVGDRVLLAARLPDEIYLLAILERILDNSRMFSLGEGASLEVERPGHLQISADKALRLRSDDLGFVAQKASVLFGHFASTVRSAFFGFSTARWVGDLVETSVDRITQWFGTSQRTVGGLDLIKAGSSEIHADQVMSIQGKQVLISAEKLARMDGDQVHIG